MYYYTIYSFGFRLPTEYVCYVCLTFYVEWGELVICSFSAIINIPLCRFDDPFLIFNAFAEDNAFNVQFPF